MKKIALIGNMNNNFFSLTRYLRDEGYQADLILVGEENSHFPPNSDSYVEDFNRYVVDGEFCKKGFFTESTVFVGDIVNCLKGYDVLIGCGYAPFFCHRYGFKLDIYIPYGDDLYRTPFFNGEFHSLHNFFNLIDEAWRWIFGRNFIMKFLRTAKLNSVYSSYRSYKLAFHQRKGIVTADVITMLVGIQNFDRVVGALCIENKIVHLPLPMIYHKQYADDVLRQHRASLPYISEIESFRASHDIVVMHHPRHIWQTNVDEFSVKGNDVLFRGIAEYLQQRGSRKVGVITLEYGPDVDASKALIESLGLTQHVLWLPLSPRKDIMSIMPLADLGANCFSHNWLTGGVLYECIVSGLPVLQKRESFIPNVFPVLESNSASDVADWLFRWDTDRDEIKRRAEAAKSWYINDVAGKAVQFYSQAINDALQHRDLDSA